MSAVFDVIGGKIAAASDGWTFVSCKQAADSLLTFTFDKRGKKWYACAFAKDFIGNGFQHARRLGEALGTEGGYPDFPSGDVSVIR